MQLFGGLFLVGLAGAVQSDYCQSFSTDKLSQLVTIKKMVSPSLNYFQPDVRTIKTSMLMIHFRVLNLR